MESATTCIAAKGRKENLKKQSYWRMKKKHWFLLKVKTHRQVKCVFLHRNIWSFDVLLFLFIYLVICFHWMSSTLTCHVRMSFFSAVRYWHCMPLLWNKSTCDLPRRGLGALVLLLLDEFLINTPKFVFIFHISWTDTIFLHLWAKRLYFYLFCDDIDKWCAIMEKTYCLYFSLDTSCSCQNMNNTTNKTDLKSWTTKSWKCPG